MLKFFSSITKQFAPGPRLPLAADEEMSGWQADPLSHPVIASMDLRQLADLQFPRSAAQASCTQMRVRRNGRSA